MSDIVTPERADVVILGGGVGGLACARSLARAGASVVVLEARASAGGLATGVVVAGKQVDGGPYILLDKPGLTFAFAKLGLDLDRLRLAPISHVYDVEQDGAPVIEMHADLEKTIESLERSFPGSGPKYRAFVAEMSRAHASLMPVLTSKNPGPLAILRAGALLTVPLLLRPLKSVFARTGLPAPVQQALGIWTYLAGQKLDEAPSPLAFVPALIHGHGTYLPAGGVARVADALVDGALEAGVTLITARATRIVVEGGAVRAVDASINGDPVRIACRAAVSNIGGVKTLLEMAPTRPKTQAWARGLPLESPGLAAYGITRRPPRGAYLRFRLLKDEKLPTRLVVRPSIVDPAQGADGQHPVRLVLPVGHAEAERLDEGGQRALLERALEEPWWRDQVGDVVIEETRVPASWGRTFGLYRDSMNPVMTAKLMRRGRMPPHVKDVRGLYIVGSSTHPGQWVSFCAVSGVLVAELVEQELR